MMNGYTRKQILSCDNDKDQRSEEVKMKRNAPKVREILKVHGNAAPGVCREILIHTTH